MPHHTPRGGNSKIAKEHCLHIKIFSRITRPFSSKLGTKHPWVQGIKICSSEWPFPFARRDNSKLNHGANPSVNLKFVQIEFHIPFQEAKITTFNQPNCIIISNFCYRLYLFLRDVSQLSNVAHGPLVTAFHLPKFCMIFSRYLIQFSKNDPSDVTWLENWKGYILAAGFFLTVLLQSFLFHQLFFWSVTLGLRIRASLVSAVYKKVSDSQLRKMPQLGIELRSIFSAQNSLEFWHEFLYHVDEKLLVNFFFSD